MFEKKIRSHNSVGVWMVGVETKNPIYIVAAEGYKTRGPVLHQCSGKYGRENALKRFRWLAWGIPYRPWQVKGGYDKTYLNSLFNVHGL